jgi:outer membrane protein TolC|tara:strand:- start:2145 stop:3473 length:1329 start_codon:yes stop_codon:yes gene_type:complete
MKNIIIIFIFIFILLLNNKLLAENNAASTTYSDIKGISLFVGQNDYIDFIRSKLFEQPEFRYAVSLSSEQEFNLKFAKRNRFPTISGSIINDESIERNIKDTSSVRKRRDDSFDANLEIRQPIYTGGSINALIRSAKSKASNSSLRKQEVISDLILEANKTYLQSAGMSFISNYAENLLAILRPYKEKVNDRVSAGIVDPVESALFFVKYSQLETFVYQLKSAAEKSDNNYSLFFKTEAIKLAFPKIEVDLNKIDLLKKSYAVESSEYAYLEKKENIISVRSEYLPKFGISARYTKYDIDDDSNEDDIRGGLYLSTPIFNFGRGSAKINAAKVAAEGQKSYIDVERKNDGINESRILSDLNNSLKNREIFIKSYQDTLKQRKAIENRIELSGFAVNALAEVILNEISQLDNLLNNESSIAQGYLMALHQNQQLNQTFKLGIN